MPTGTRQDWAEALERLEQGDRLALLRLTRLLNGFLSRWNAYDFQDEWEDLIQEVLVAALRAQSEGRIRERAHTYGFLKTVARNKFVDRLKAKLRSPADGSLPWEEIVEGELDPGNDGVDPTLSADLREGLERLDDKHRASIIAVYVNGQTHDEAVAATGIPLGSLRRYLREGLASLELSLSAQFGRAGPASSTNSEPDQ